MRYQPDAQRRRFLASETALRESGGRRLNVRLQLSAATALRGMMDARQCKQSGAVDWALRWASGSGIIRTAEVITAD